MVSQKRHKRAIATLLSNLAEYPYTPAKYEIGDKVIHQFVNDDSIDLYNYGRSFVMVGYITGVIWCSENFRKGWTYQVHWIETDGVDWQKNYRTRIS